MTNSRLFFLAVPVRRKIASATVVHVLQAVRTFREAMFFDSRMESVGLVATEDRSLSDQSFFSS